MDESYFKGALTFNLKIMLTKVTELFNSIRFWQVTLAAGFLLAGHYLPDQIFLWNTLAGWLATVAGIGTLDSVAQKVSGTPIVNVGVPVAPPSETL